METLSKHRASIIASISKLSSYTANCGDTIPSYDELKVRLDNTHALLNAFKEVEHKILSKPAGQSEMQTFEDFYYTAVSTITALIRDKHPAMMPASPNLLSSTLTNQTSTPINADIKLPRLNIPCFEGEYKDWQAFHDLFMKAVHENVSLSAAQKFQYLKGYLKGEASILLKNIATTDVNYFEAWKKLCERYNKKRQITNSYLKEFYELPSLRELSATNLRRIIDKSDEILRGLKTLGPEAESRDPWIIYILVQKLDEDSRKSWANHSAKKDFPSYDDLIQFLHNRADAVEAFLDSSKSLKRTTSNTNNSSRTYTATINPAICPLCSNQQHNLYTCKAFHAMTIADKRAFVIKGNRCFNCLSSRHALNQCKSKASCQVCSKRHHTLLHSQSPNAASSSTNSYQPHSHSFAPGTSPHSPSTQQATEQHPHTPPHTASSNAAALRNAHFNQEHIVRKSILPTAIINVNDINGKIVPCKVLLDSGSEVSFISQSFLNILQLPTVYAKIQVSGVSSTHAGYTKGKATITASSLYNTMPKYAFDVYVLDKLTSKLSATTTLDEVNYSKLRELLLADPDYMKPQPIDVIIGADYFFDLFKSERIFSHTGQQIAQQSTFGWVVTGRHEPGNNIPQSTLHGFHSTVQTDEILQQFWTLEEIPTASVLTPEEQFAEEHFITTTVRDTSGRFVVRLPLVESSSQLGMSYSAAHRRLLSMERRFNNNESLRISYNKFMNDYQALGHMEEIPSDQLDNTTHKFYLPHHAVLKDDSTTTKLRVVFDASSKSSSSKSLNNLLAVGPTIQDTLFAILLRFRLHTYVFCADIEKMYRQIRVAEVDTDLQRILWRSDPNAHIQHFRLRTVTYGTASAPFQAVRVLQQLADIHAAQHPLSSAIIRYDFYVDDLLSGANDVDTAKTRICEITDILKSAGFNLRKFKSNSTHILRILPQESCDASPIDIIHDQQCTKLLGIQWNPQHDKFQFIIQEHHDLATITKRTLLSEAARIFDPMGWLAPSIIQVKILFQELWMQNLSWDEPLPESTKTKWLQLRQDLVSLNSLKLDRWVHTNDDEFELHAFSDASEKAYAAAVYIRSMTSHDQPQVHLLVSKTKVAPLKQQSIPRLELCAAALLCKLIKTVRTSLRREIKCIQAYTDSTIVLHWLASHPRKFKTFVANRSSLIQSILPRTSWYHVPSLQNPADLASRGIPAAQLIKSNLWWHGPEWLSQNTIILPPQDFTIPHGHISEEVKVTSHTATLTASKFVSQFVESHSSWSRLTRVLSHIFRFYHNITTPSKPLRSHLTVAELHHATNFLIKWVQEDVFYEEFQSIRNKTDLPRHSKLKSLHPFLDKHGVLRVGGRLQESNLSYQSQHPIILPKTHHLTTLIVSYYHLNFLHPGPSALSAYLRQSYWILGSRIIIKRITHQCIKCFRQKKQMTEQLMGNLPESRCRFIRPFHQTGVDYAGPLSIRPYKGKGRITQKGYIALFICLSTKAIHLELVYSLTTEAFIAALRRFQSRRGMPADIFSDNGTNFIGAKRYLGEIYATISTSEHNEAICNFLSKNRTQWHTIPPQAPNFGGLWESAVKSTKHHLKRVIGDNILTYEEMNTLLAQIEAILNSRPLCSQSADELNPLTPAHFIIGQPLTLMPDQSHTYKAFSITKRWEHIQQMSHHFWKRWHHEYLTTLQQRPKWQTAKQNVEVNDLVLIREINSPLAKWLMGKIVATHPGKDNITRVATVKTVHGIYKRPISKLVLLPNES